MIAERYNAKEILAFKEGNLVPKHDSVLIRLLDILLLYLYF